MDTQRTFTVLSENEHTRDSLEVGGAEYGTTTAEAGLFINYEINLDEEAR